MYSLLYVKLNVMLDNVYICVAENKCCAFWFTCLCVHTLSLENDIQTKKDQKKISKVIDRLSITDGENVREVNVFCQRNDTERVRK